MRLSAFQFAKGLRAGKLEKLIGKKVMYRYANKDKPVIGIVATVSFSGSHNTGYQVRNLGVRLDEQTCITRHIKSWEIIL